MASRSRRPAPSSRLRLPGWNGRKPVTVPGRDEAIKRLTDLKALVGNTDLSSLPTDPGTAKALLASALKKVAQGDIAGANRAADEIDGLIDMAKKGKLKQIDGAMKAQDSGLAAMASKSDADAKRVANLRACYSDAVARGDIDFAQKILATTTDVLTPKPLVPAGTPLSDDDCEKIVRDEKGWTNVKKKYIPTLDRMKEIIAYRKKFVNALLAELKASVAHGDLIAKSVGSDNPTSDYDITVASKDTPGLEIDVVKAFNARVQAKFGVPPGVAFDTNLYVKDFLSLKGNIEGLGGDDAPIEQSDVGYERSDDSDQDVGSLIKQRQYMPADEWKTYVDGVKKGVQGNPAKLAEVTQQFEESDALYLLNMREKADRFLAKLKEAVPAITRTPHLAELEAWFDKLKDPATVYTQKLDSEMQRKLDELSEVSQHDAPDVALAANNEIYLEKMTAVREVQKRHRAMDAATEKIAKIPDRGIKLKAAQAMLEKLYPAPKEGDGNPELIAQQRQDAMTEFELYKKSTTLDIDVFLADKIDGMKAQAKKQVAEANFHAPEAYLSEGALDHVVGGVQGGGSIENLSSESFLQSMNEQFGDFLKDCGHYKSDDGQAFVQTSKYIQRMVESMALMLKKLGVTDIEPSLPTPFNGLAALKAAIEAQLLPIRGLKGDYATMPDDERWLAGQKAGSNVFGVSSIGALRSKISAVNAQVTAAVRARMEMKPSDTETRAFHRNRDKQAADVGKAA